MTHPVPAPAAGQGGALAPVKDQGARGLLMPMFTAAQITALHDSVALLIQGAFKEGLDFGKIPGTGDRKTLLKPGAEKIVTAFGASVRFEIVEKEVDHDRETRWVKNYKNGPSKSGISFGLYRYVIRAVVFSMQTGEVLGEGMGSASTMEGKYVDRPRDSENTVLKMATKRALVAAALGTFGLSDRFTQDVEDLPAGAVAGDGHDEPAPPKRQVPKVETLDDAKAVPLPGAPEKWGGNGGKLLADVPVKVVKAFRKWAKTAIDKAGAEGNEPDEMLVAWAKASKMILDAAGESEEEAPKAAPKDTPAAPASPAEVSTKPAPRSQDAALATGEGEDLDGEDDDLPF